MKFWPQALLLVSCVASCALISTADANATRPAKRAHMGPPPLENVPTQPTNQPDPYLNRAWHLKAIRANDAWRVTQGSPNISIAVIDSGIDYNHPDLNPNLRRNLKEWPMNDEDDDGNGFIDDVIGWDFVKGQALPWDRTGHGTFVAGIAAAVAGNGVGSAGVCPKCTILPVRFLNSDGMGWDEDGLDALRYAVMMRSPVINISFAGEGYDRDYHEILKKAAERDIVVVAAAGNDGENIDRESVYPPKFKGLPNMIVVAAVDKYDALIKDKDSGHGSNWSKTYVHVAAPGSEIVAPWNDGTYESLDGTSYAAPVVAGTAALIRSANPKLTAPQIVQIIMATSRKVGALENKLVSGGVVDAAAAVDCAVRANNPCLK